MGPRGWRFEPSHSDVIETIELAHESVKNIALALAGFRDDLDLLDAALEGCEKVAAAIPKPKDKL